MASGTENLEALESEARTAVVGASHVQALREVRASYLGRKGSISALLRTVGQLPPEERGEVGQAVNAAKQRLEALVQEREAELERVSQARSLAEHRLDVTLPSDAPALGGLHPVTHLEREMCAFFASLGFSIEDGPEVETEYHCFDALNIGPDHPARDMHDTFFVAGGHVLRTHTSPVQIRTMAGRQPPFRFIAPGRVYRHDYDATHAPMFHQIEGFMVDESVTMAHLKGVLYAFARHLFGDEVRVRFRAHFFPFTEPSAEIDFWWRDRWLEWGGCGMIHPQVLANCGIDARRYQGFAFGMGIDRTAMDRFGIPNIHLMLDGDVRVLEQVR
jgi:phenylalanyl-tRNA synthetase alpha chain